MNSPIRVGHLGLLDAAPLLVAQAQGFFRDEGLDVVLSCELGVATLCGKLADQQLVGACIPPHLAVLLSMGAQVPRVAVSAVRLCSRQGYALVLLPEGAVAAPRLAKRLGAALPGTPARLFLQQLALRLPDPVGRDAELMPLSLSQLLGFLSEGMVDGFIGPDPLPLLATKTMDATVQPLVAEPFKNHPGSVLALRTDFTDLRGPTVQALGRALDRAQHVCADPASWGEIARLVLGQPLYAGLEQDVSRLAPLAPDTAALSTRFETGGFGPADADFVSAACRAVLGPAARQVELAREIERVFAFSRVARTPAGAAR